jgi:hypothetical protein
MTTLPTITQYTGQVPDRTTMDKNTFANSVYYYLKYFNGTFTPQSNDFATKLNTLSGELTQVRDDTINAKNDAENAKNIALASANFDGEWDSSKSYTHPVSVIYNNVYYLSLQDSTGKEPDTNPTYWVSFNPEYNSQQNADFTCTPFYRYFVDTSNNIVNATIPSNTAEYTKISFEDLKGTFDTNKLVIKREDTNETIMGKAEDMEVTTKNISFVMIKVGTDWRLI